MTTDNIERLPSSIYQQQCRRYVDAGYQPRPVNPGGKRCKVPGWRADVATVAEPRGLDCGLGLRLGTKFADGTRLTASDADRNEFVQLMRALVPSPCGRFGSKGIAALFARVADEVAKFDLKLTAGGKAGEFLGTTSLCVIPPTVHPDTGQPYRWTDKPLLEIGWRDLPVIDPELIAAVFASEHLPEIMAGTGTHDAVLKFVGELANLSDYFGYIERVVTAAFPDGYSGNSLKELPGMIRDTANKFATGKWVKPNTVTAGGAPKFSEEHLAQEFVARHGNEFQHVAKGMGWMVWDDSHWREDEKRSAFSRARAITREFARQASKQLKRTVASAKTRAAIVSLAQDDEIIAATVDQWDADLWLLNTPGGTVELKTGVVWPHNRADHLTKITAVAPDPTCPIPLWLAFLERVTAGDAELQDYLQRVIGYCLTGLTVEHALFFLYGTGANGKSTFIETVTGIAADYARPVPMEALMWSRNERHPTDIAGLRGARIGSAIETGKGRSWDEPKITLLTGGDKISARLMRQDFFDFVPQFKLIVAGNHKPGLRSVNEAIRRRLHLIPFTVTIPKEERDPHLAEKLKAEWPGILAWMVEGCLQWQRPPHGLAPPTIVTEATDDYLEAQDIVAQFLDETCVIDPREEIKSSAIFDAWKIFAEKIGERLRPQKDFNSDIEGKGYKQVRDKRGIWFKGLRLKTPDE